MASLEAALSSDVSIPPSSSSVTDEPCSTPPSSPPAYPWESQQPISTSQTPKQEVKPIRNALSVLGKRKAVLQETSNNARAPKRQHVKADGSKQMQLSLGQKVEKTCNDCGMMYVVSSEEDRKLHDNYHDISQRGCIVGKDFVQRLGAANLLRVHRVRDSDDTVCVVTRDDPKWRRIHARAVLNVVTRSLGAVTISDEDLWTQATTDVQSGTYEMYLCIRDGRCIAAALVERLKQKVRKVLRPPAQQVMSGGTNALSRLQARRAATATTAWQASEALFDAKIGISRIWTAPTCRGQGAAKLLLDCVYARLGDSNEGTKTSKPQLVAFSQPTDAGFRLAREWFNQSYNWFVY